MLKKVFAALLCTVVAALGAWSAEPGMRSDANIIGHVTDSETGEHLPYYAIKLLGTHYVTLTDASGHYAFRDLAPGEYSVEASFTGYATQTKKINVKAHTTVEVNFDVETDAFLLDQVVVTSSKSEQNRRNTPALVNVLGNQTFRMVNAASLADGLNFQPGVRVENNCQNCGFTQVRMNGLDGHYSQILMNSRPVFSALAGVYGLEQIPASMIDRVEVMRGGGSALFGSSAVGGTINIITKDPEVNSATVSHTLTSIGMTRAFDNNTTFNASVVTDNSKAGLFIYGQSRNRDGYDAGTDGFTEIAQLKGQTIGTRGFLRTSDDTRLTLEYHATHEYRRGGDNLDLPAHQAMVAEQTDHNIHAGELSYDIWSHDRKDHAAIFAALQSTRRQSYYGSEMDPNAYGRTSDMVVTAGVQWTHSMDRFLFMPAQLVAGVEYDYNRLHDVTVGYDHNSLQKVNIFGAYAQNEWKDDRWGLLFGCRVDKHSLIGNPVFSPRVNLRYNAGRTLNLRASFSTGFRSPQAYDEDFHVAVVGGERVVTVLADNLKQENSRSVSASADYYTRLGNVQMNLTLEGFYTDLSDVFALREIGTDAAGNAVLERYNGSGARVFGGSLEAKLALPAHMQLQAGITVQQSRNKQPEQWSDNPEVAPVRKMFRTPDVYGYFTYDWDVTRALCIIATGTLTGPMDVQHLVGSGTDVDVVKRTSTFFDAQLKAAYTFHIFSRVNLEASLSLSNIFNSYQRDFDTGYRRDSGYIYGPMTPRSLTAGLRISI